MVSQLTPALSRLWAEQSSPPTAPFLEVPFLPMHKHINYLINDEVSFKGCFPTTCSHSFCQKCVSGFDLDSELDFTSVGHKMYFKNPHLLQSCVGLKADAQSVAESLRGVTQHTPKDSF